MAAGIDAVDEWRTRLEAQADELNEKQENAAELCANSGTAFYNTVRF